MNFKPGIFAFLIISIFVCCDGFNSEVCIRNQDFGKFELLPGSLNTIPFEDSVTLVFKNEMNDFLELNANPYFALGSFSTAGFCEFDRSVWEEKRWRFDCKHVNFEHDSLELKFKISLGAVSKHNNETPNENDNLAFRVKIESEDFGYRRIMDLLVDGTKVEEAVEAEFIPVWKIFDKTFSDVYHGEAESSDLTNSFYYNFTEGIVGFEDYRGVLWVFDHVK